MRMKRLPLPSWVYQIKNLKQTLKFAVACLITGLFTALLAGRWMGKISTRTVVLVIVGLLIVGALVGVYYLFLKWKKRKQAAMFGQVMAQEGAATEGLTTAEQIAQNDRMREAFEKGIDTFNQHGKDLYSLPWYLVIGEPGSGFPPACRRNCKAWAAP